ncbi:hypothetical protein K443DRAFT_170303 [Laccaria amethystina LaAM-08-1]|uniref:Uncharacterized protein n=1 Tax=Laccaria amethystina LaAM-08-1 TaxID=1095629 RepID=A0A0C9Y1C4_9AGAR|nr:hypothetical protein K443DRAFT_170303 [Laccaria amethystina LaAM-08-1]
MGELSRDFLLLVSGGFGLPPQSEWCGVVSFQPPSSLHPSSFQPSSLRNSLLYPFPPLFPPPFNPLPSNFLHVGNHALPSAQIPKFIHPPSAFFTTWLPQHDAQSVRRAKEKCVPTLNGKHG